MTQSNPSTPKLLQISDLCWSAGSRSILSQINLSLTAGAFVGLIGPNGAGKTSLLRCMNGFYQPQSGSVTYKDRLLSQWSRADLAKEMALVGQRGEELLQLNLFELVRMGLIPYKSPFAGDTQQDMELISTCLDRVGLLDKANQSVSTLSGGEQQRAMIAKALVQQPEFLLLDEPTNHLDLCYQHEILSFLQALPMTLIASLHDINLAAQYCDQLILLKEGRVMACGPVQEVFTADNLSELFGVECRVDKHPFHDALWMNLLSSGGAS